MNVAKFQIGKSGITENFLESLRNSFKNRKFVRISAIKSSGRDKKSIVEMAEKLKKEIGFSCEYKIIGFTIVLRKLSKKKHRFINIFF